MIKILRDCGDILDRGSIAKLKSERIREDICHKEWQAFKEEIDKLIVKYKDIPISMFFDLLYKINAGIWELEADMRKGKLDGVLYEVGKRAIKIREFNNLRVSVKNIINVLTKTGFIDIKKDHLSENE